MGSDPRRGVWPLQHSPANRLLTRYESLRKQFGAILLEPLRCGLGIQTPEDSSFDLLLSLPDSTRDHRAFNRLVLRHTQLSQDVFDPVSGKHSQHGIIERQVMREPAAAWQLVCKLLQTIIDRR